MHLVADPKDIFTTLFEAGSPMKSYLANEVLFCVMSVANAVYISNCDTPELFRLNIVKK